VHLDPSRDPTEHYASAFDLFGDLWDCGRWRRATAAGDEFIEQLVEPLQNQLVGAALTQDANSHVVLPCLIYAQPSIALTCARKHKCS
jgi:hypothetical protein